MNLHIYTKQISNYFDWKVQVTWCHNCCSRCFVSAQSSNKLTFHNTVTLIITRFYPPVNNVLVSAYMMNDLLRVKYLLSSFKFPKIKYLISFAKCLNVNHKHNKSLLPNNNSGVEAGAEWFLTYKIILSF